VKKPPILIFGVPRSGTTLLRTILNCHPHIACGPEAPWLANHASHNVMALFESLTAGEYAFSRNFGVPPDRVLARLREFVDGLFTDFASQQGKARWAHKTPDDCLYVPFYTQLFPEARYLHIVRHPLDVALSTARIPTHQKGVSPWHEEHLLFEQGCVTQNTLFTCMLRCRRWNDRIRTDLAGRACHRLSYEDLVAKPAETMAEVCAFLDEPFPPEILDYAKFNTIFPSWERGSVDVRAAGGITGSRVGRWKTELTADETRLLFSLADPRAAATPPTEPVLSAVRLANTSETISPLFAGLIEGLNALGAPLSLYTFTNWSKIWEYPWLWFHGLETMDGADLRIVDIGSQFSPMPWLLAARGARVTLIETDPHWIPMWEKARAALHVAVDWHIVSSETLPLPDACADAVTSFSVIEHMRDKPRAIAEAVRILKPQAPLFISFDICEPAMGMTFPEWNGHALTMAEFEREIWFHPAFGNREKPQWNLADIPAFQAWHLRSAPHHNYVVGAAVLVKRH
jgi:SAM-dependent methyltransferase